MRWAKLPASRFRKGFGGGMRQTGFLAACAAFALTHNFPKLSAVHDLARKLERGLLELGVEITVSAETCMVRLIPPATSWDSNLFTARNKVFYDPSSVGINYAEVAERAGKLPKPLSLLGSRLVVHMQTSEEAIADFLGVIRSLAEEKKSAGFVRPVGKAGNSSYKDMYAPMK
jgi:threonine aldolase